MLSVFLSGHTQGVGKEIFNYYSNNKEVEIRGESRSTGFDISKNEDRKRILNASKDADVIILNAHDNYSQIDLLYDLFLQFREQDKRIIVIGSLSNLGLKDFPYPYAIQKKALREACLQLQNCHSNLSITLLNPGWISTEKSESVSSDKKIPAHSFCKILDLIIYSEKSLLIKELSFEAKEEFSKDKVLPSPFE